jgi:hypothetical protein
MKSPHPAFGHPLPGNRGEGVETSPAAENLIAPHTTPHTGFHVKRPTKTSFCLEFMYLVNIGHP